MSPYWAAGLIAIAAVFVAAAGFSPFLLSGLVPDGAAVLHYAPAALLLLAVAALARLLVQRRPVGGVAAVAAVMWLLFVIAGASYLPAIERLRPVKEICRVIRREARPQDEIGYYRAAVPSMLFYLRRPIFSVSDPDTMVRSFQSEARVFCVVSPNDYEYFTQERKVTLTVLGRYAQLPTRLRTVLAGRPAPGDDLLLVTNRPTSAAGDDRQKNP
jgi:hypothetical protein